MHPVMGRGRLIAGRYRLGDPIGRGAMGIVWQGRDELLARDVAVKEVQITAQAMPADAELIYQRTLREARAAASLSHPGAVTVFDVVEENGTPWIVMELVKGRSLDRVIAEDGPLPPREAAEFGTSLLGALASAHSAGVLHRDVKPSNVLVTDDGRAVLTDFGIATFACDPSQTQSGMVVGTPGFTAPERVRGEGATAASDLWSLGATLYAAVEGRGPFERAGGSDAITLGVAQEDAPRAPSAGPLATVIDALLRRDPDARPEAAAAARLLAEAAAVTAPPPPVSAVLEPPVFAELSMPKPDQADDLSGGYGGPVPWQPLKRTSGRWRLLLTGVGAATIGTVAFVGWYLHGSTQPVQALQNPTTPGITAPGSVDPPANGPSGAANRSSSGAAGSAHGSSANSQPPGDGELSSATSGGPGGSTSPWPSSPSPSSSGSIGPSPSPSPSPRSMGPVLPRGYVWHRFTAAVMGTAAGFEIGVPSAWQQSVTALSARLDLKASNFQLTVNLAPWTLAGPLAQAEHLESLAAKADAGYTQLSLGVIGFKAVGGFVAAPAAQLKFRWSKLSVGSVTELVVLVTLTTKSGPQPYTFSLIAPTATFASANSIFNAAMPTFRPLPG